MIRLTTLGNLDLRGPEDRVIRSVVHQPKRLALLTYLALAAPDGFVRRDVLLGVFWPEYEQDRARRALNQAIHYLRRSLGKGVIESRGTEEVGIPDGVLWCDAVAFTSALDESRSEAALALYQGEFMPGFHLDGVPEFERWLERQRTHLRDRAAGAAWTLADRDRAAGNSVGAVHWARTAAGFTPYDEPAHRRLIRLLAETGDRAGALRVFDQLTSRLAETLDAEPSPETQELVAQIRAGAEETDRGNRSTGPATDGEHPATPPPPSAPAVPAHPQPSTPGPGAETTVSAPPPTAPRHRRIHPAWLVSGALVVVTTVLLAALLRPDGAAAPPTIRDVVRADGPTRLVVEGFEDYSSDGELGYLAKALTTTLVDQLAPVPTLQVVAADADDRADDGAPGPDTAPPTPPAAPDLRVQGSVLASAGRLRVNVQLVDAATGAAVETFYVEEPMGELFTLLDEVSSQVSTALRRELGREIRMKRWRAGTDVPEAWDAVQRAQWYRDKAEELRDSRAYRSAAEALETADSLLAVAEERDPDWVTPTVQRGEVARDLGWLYFSPPLRELGRHESYLDEGIQHASRALEKTPDHAGALELRGVLQHLSVLFAPPQMPPSVAGRLRAAEKDLRQALSLQPARARAWSRLSAVLNTKGEFAEANFAAARAFQTDAYLDNVQEILSRLVTTSLEMGDKAAAQRWCAEIHRRFSQNWIAHRCTLRIAAWSEGLSESQVDALRNVLTRAYEQNRVPEIVKPKLEMLLAIAFVRSGRRDRAQQQIEQIDHSSNDPELLRLEAAARLLLGEKDSAAALLHRYINERPATRSGAARSRLFAPLRGHPKFRNMKGPRGIVSQDAHREPQT